MKPGIYKDLSIEKYHSSEGLSKTGLCLLDEAPALYEHYYLGEKRLSKDSPSKRLGKMFHAMMDGSFEDEYAVGPTVRRNTNIWKEFVSENPNKECVQESEVSESRQMVKKIHEFGPTKDLLKDDGLYETSFFWKDPATGLLCKCRPDYISSDYKTVVDFKTARAADPESFRWDAYKYHYYVSSAFTLDGIQSTTGIRPDRYIFLVILNSAPHLVSAYEATPDEIELGQAFIWRGLHTFKACRDSGRWPGFKEEVLPLGLPYRGRGDLEAQRDAERQFSTLVG